MSRFVAARSATIPAGTAVASPVTVDVSIPEASITEVEILVPPGPNGLMGFRLANAGTQVIPYLSDDWIISNEETISWPLTEQITSGSWQVTGYNTGQFDHTIYLRFLITPVTDTTGSALPAPIPAELISSPPPLDVVTP